MGRRNEVKLASRHKNRPEGPPTRNRLVYNIQIYILLIIYIQNNIYTNTSDPTRSRESLRGKTHLFDTKSWLVIIGNTDSASLLPYYIIISIINIFVIVMNISIQLKNKRHNSLVYFHGPNSQEQSLRYISIIIIISSIICSIISISSSMMIVIITIKILMIFI